VKSTLSPGILFCPTDACSATFDNEQQLMEHEQKAEHFYAENSSLSTMDRARCIYIDHLKGARLVEEISNKAAIESINNLDADNVILRQDNRELNRIFLRQGCAIRRRQKTTKTTQEHQQFFMELFRVGENTGKKITVEKAFEEMRRAVNSNNSKRFTTNQYLNKSQIRGIFGRLTKKGASKRQIQMMKNNEKDDTASSSDDADANDYFMIQQIQQIDDLKAREIANAMDSSSDDEGDEN
jgi:hypothetical protein